MKFFFLFILSALASFAQVPELSSRRLWNASPDDVTKALMYRVESHLANDELDKAEELLVVINIINNKTIITDEYNPNNTRFLRFTPQYCANQFRGIATALESLLPFLKWTRNNTQALEIMTMAKTYRNAAALLEFNMVPKN